MHKTLSREIHSEDEFFHIINYLLKNIIYYHIQVVYTLDTDTVKWWSDSKRFESFFNSNGVSKEILFREDNSKSKILLSLIDTHLLLRANILKVDKDGFFLEVPGKINGYSFYKVENE